MKVYVVAIYLKSGSIIRGRFETLDLTPSDIGGGYDRVEWKSFGFPKLMSLVLNDISAVTVEAEEEVDDE